MRRSIQILFILLIINCLSVYARHPAILLTPRGVKEIKSAVGKIPGFDKSFAEQKEIADNAIRSEIIVPVPRDGGGGYTHEKHKNNYYEMYAAGLMYQLTGEKKYGFFVKEMLLKYAEIFPVLPLHPASKTDTPGKIFWQLLNDNVWLVHTSIAYDCVYNFISTEEREKIEKNLFYPMTDFIMNGSPANKAVFNKMHNHGTWATAAVGMIGYVMNDKDLIDKALYGSVKDGKTGFIRQLDVLFSPDGYFTEGPYYQRYAIWPFMTFAQAIQNKQPEIGIFKYRNSILNKAVNVLIQCAYNGEIFYLNDALTKTYQCQELVYAVDIAFKNYSENTFLAGIARQQNAFIIADAGIAAAKASTKEAVKPVVLSSVLLSDGPKGDEGGIGILRSGNDEKHSCLTFKATSHGLSHGHYDKLSISLYDNGNQIIPDYGAARFLNIEPKFGGHYTLENSTWAKQSIAHNTISVDEKCQFNADINISSQHHSDVLYHDFSQPDFQIISGVDENAYPGLRLHRTCLLFKDESFDFPVLFDIFKVTSDGPEHSCDLPYYYKGQLISSTIHLKKNLSELTPLGTANGYQHLWVEAKGKTENKTACFTWLNGNRFYSLTTLSDFNTDFYITRVGANDPDFNLRSETGFLLRQNKVKNHTFVSVIEPHGFYDMSKEITQKFISSIAGIEIIVDNEQLTAVEISLKSGVKFIFATKNDKSKLAESCSFNYNNTSLSFNSKYFFKKTE